MIGRVLLVVALLAVFACGQESPPRFSPQYERVLASWREYMDSVDAQTPLLREVVLSVVSEGPMFSPSPERAKKLRAALAEHEKQGAALRRLLGEEAPENSSQFEVLPWQQSARQRVENEVRRKLLKPKPKRRQPRRRGRR